MRETLISVGLYLVSLAIAGASGALGGIWYLRHQTPPPRLLVVDMRRLVEPVLADSTLPEAERRERITQIGTAVSRMLNQYSQEGAIVLDASAVLRAPRQAYVQP
jgi:hypothetical protein